MEWFFNFLTALSLSLFYCLTIKNYCKLINNYAKILLTITSQRGSRIVFYKYQCKETGLVGMGCFIYDVILYDNLIAINDYL